AASRPGRPPVRGRLRLALPWRPLRPAVLKRRFAGRKHHGSLTWLLPLGPERRLGTFQHTTEPQPRDADGAAGLVVRLDSEAAHGRGTHSRLEALARDAGEEAVDRFRGIHAQ